MHTIVRNLHTRDLDLCDSGVLEVSDGDTVVYRSRYGLDLGLALGPGSTDARRDYRSVLSIERVATERDVAEADGHRSAEDEALRACMALVDEHALEMRIVSAHYLLDQSKMLIFFAAEHRVDFRALVRDLVERVHARVELRQIGVRDETRINGGIGVCGRRLCCNSFSDRLGSVSIRMAKDQNYSLNSMKVSGHCGRLLCCLAYEHEFYQEERKVYPKEGSWVVVDEERYRVNEINVLSGEIRMFGPAGQYLVVPVCALERLSDSRRRGGPAWTLKQEGCRHLQTADDTE